MQRYYTSAVLTIVWGHFLLLGASFLTYIIICTITAFLLQIPSGHQCFFSSSCRFSIALDSRNS